jgi:hypothetical protein
MDPFTVRNFTKLYIPCITTTIVVGFSTTPENEFFFPCDLDFNYHCTFTIPAVIK